MYDDLEREQGLDGSADDTLTEAQSDTFVAAKDAKAIRLLGKTIPLKFAVGGVGSFCLLIVIIIAAVSSDDSGSSGGVGGTGGSSTQHHTHQQQQLLHPGGGGTSTNNSQDIPSSTSQQTVPALRLVGANSERVNGLYATCQTTSGASVYCKIGDEGLVLGFSAQGGMWLIECMAGGTGEIYYTFDSSDGATVPTGGWSALGSTVHATAPGPTVYVCSTFPNTCNPPTSTSSAALRLVGANSERVNGLYATCQTTSGASVYCKIGDE
eukprot:COSAG01_NODE_19357_length_1014_cov_31.185792_1_plen_266_part_10